MSDEHPGKGFGCDWVGSKQYGLIVSLFEAWLWQYYNFPIQDQCQGEGLHNCPEPQPLRKQVWSGWAHLFADSNLGSCSLLRSESPFPLFEDSANQYMYLRKQPVLGHVCCDSSLIQRGGMEGTEEGQWIVTGPLLVGCGGYLPREGNEKWGKRLISVVQTLNIQAGLFCALCHALSSWATQVRRVGAGTALWEKLCRVFFAWIQPLSYIQTCVNSDLLWSHAHKISV